MITRARTVRDGRCIHAEQAPQVCSAGGPLLMVTPCRSAFFLAFSSWWGDWSMRVTLRAGIVFTMPCVQKPVPPPTSTTCCTMMLHTSGRRHVCPNKFWTPHRLRKGDARRDKGLTAHHHEWTVHMMGRMVLDIPSV